MIYDCGICFARISSFAILLCGVVPFYGPCFNYKVDDIIAVAFVWIYVDLYLINSWSLLINK